MSLEKKWEKEGLPLKPLTNGKLICGTCANQIEGRAVDCKMYHTKPLSVLKGGACYDWKKRSV